MSDVVHHTPHITPTVLAPIFSAVTTKGGGTAYLTSLAGRRKVFVYEPRCHVCNADKEVVDSIHRLAANGTPIARITKMLPPEVKFSNRQVKHHLETHVSEYAMYERAVSSAAQAFGEGEFPARVSGLHASQIILERGTMLLAEGRVEVKATDILAAARFQHEMESEGKSVADASAYSTMMTVLLGKFYHAMGPARFNSVMFTLASDPRIAEIMRDTGISPAEAVEREIQIQNTPLRELISTM